MKNPLALIIDDEPDIRELLEITLKRMDMDCYCAENLSGARELLTEHTFNICLTDMRLPDGNGVEFVTFIQKNYPQLPIAVITAHGNMEIAIQALKSGAFDFLTKPIDLTSLRKLVSDAVKLSSKHKKASKDLIGVSKATDNIRQSITKLARSQAPVYISGESGTGKELVARLIHENGSRSDSPFVPVNCGAIPHDLIESELFGHMKGSFTGAVADKDGLFTAAQGGTIFFDEIADLPQNLQVKLLRVIQEKSFRPIGSTKELSTDVRILSATHYDLGDFVKQGRFRQDLYYRINVIELNIPPLRERPEDIRLLVDHILDNLIHTNHLKKIPVVNDDAMDAIMKYQFPGNVRELENILERAVTLCENFQITEGDLCLPENENGVAAHQSENHNSKNQGALDSYLVDIERQSILEALEKTRWNRTAAARLLGISLRALRYRLDKLDLD